MKTYKPRRKGSIPKGSDFLAKLRTLPTLSDKRSHVVEANPLLLIFGTNINPRNPYERDN